MLVEGGEDEVVARREREAVALARKVSGRGQELSESQEVLLERWTAKHARAFLTVAKIFVSYLQVVGITRIVQLQWPQPLRPVSHLDPTALPSQLSLDCALPHYSARNKAILQSVLLTLLPVFLAAGAAVVWLLLARVEQKRHRFATRRQLVDFLRDRMTLTIVQICYYLYPLVCLTVFQIFTCTDMDTLHAGDTVSRAYSARYPLYLLLHKSFWTQHYDTVCYQGSHFVLFITVGLPGLVLFCLGFPAWAAQRLWRHRVELYHPGVVLKYGFLYEEYQLDYYFWEPLIMLRKFALLVCTVFLAQIGPAAQLLTAMAVLSGCVFLQIKFQPLNLPRMNTLETLSLFTTQVSTIGLAYLLPAVNTPYGLRLLITIVLSLLNFLVILYFLYHLLFIAREWLKGIDFNTMKDYYTRATQRVSEGVTRVKDSFTSRRRRKPLQFTLPDPPPPLSPLHPKNPFAATTSSLPAAATPAAGPLAAAAAPAVPPRIPTANPITPAALPSPSRLYNSPPGASPRSQAPIATPRCGPAPAAASSAAALPAPSRHHNLPPVTPPDTQTPTNSPRIPADAQVITITTSPA